jgi:hypothetical protein
VLRHMLRVRDIRLSYWDRDKTYRMYFSLALRLDCERWDRERCLIREKLKRLCPAKNGVG